MHLCMCNTKCHHCHSRICNLYRCSYFWVGSYLGHGKWCLFIYMGYWGLQLRFITTQYCMRSLPFPISGKMPKQNCQLIHMCASPVRMVLFLCMCHYFVLLLSSGLLSNHHILTVYTVQNVWYPVAVTEYLEYEFLQCFQLKLCVNTVSGVKIR